MKRLPILLVSSVLAVGACTPQPQAVGLGGRTFLSTRVTQGGAPRPLVANTQIRLAFQPEGNLGASAGCNSIGGTYRIDGGILLVEPSAMTEMGCDPDRHAQDDWLVEFLASGPTITLAGNDLTLQGGATAVTLLDAEVAEPDRPLTGTRWTLESIRAGDAVSSVPHDARATLEITADGTATFGTGCNEGGARVTVDGDRIRFADVVTTKRACLDAGADMERAVLSVLTSDALRWSIDAGRLTLDAGATGLDLQAG